MSWAHIPLYFLEHLTCSHNIWSVSAESVRYALLLSLFGWGGWENRTSTLGGKLFSVSTLQLFKPVLSPFSGLYPDQANSLAYNFTVLVFPPLLFGSAPRVGYKHLPAWQLSPPKDVLLVLSFSPWQCCSFVVGPQIESCLFNRLILEGQTKQR